MVKQNENSSRDGVLKGMSLALEGPQFLGLGSKLWSMFLKLAELVNLVRSNSDDDDIVAVAGEDEP